MECEDSTMQWMEPLIFFFLEGQSISTPASQLHLKSPSLTLLGSQILSGALEDPGLLVASLGLCQAFVQNCQLGTG